MGLVAVAAHLGLCTDYNTSSSGVGVSLNMDRVDLRIDGDEYWVEGGDFDDMLEAVRDITGRRFDKEEKAWILPVDARRAAEALRPFKLMYHDDDPLSDSRSIEVLPP